MPKRFFVSPQGGGRSWVIQTERSSLSMLETRNRNEAIEKGREIAQQEHGILSIQNKEGRIEDTVSFE